MSALLWIPLLGSSATLAAGVAVPGIFPFLFFAGIWGTSFPHTFAGFTRKDLRNPRDIGKALLIYGLVLFPVLLLRADYDLRALFVLYFFWQQFHYARQAYGICKRETGLREMGSFDSTCFVAIQLIGAFTALSKGPQAFFGYALSNPLPFTLSPLAGGLLILGLSALHLSLRPANTRVHLLTHTGAVLAAFVSGNHFLEGWLALNLFHNLQYLVLMIRDHGGLKNLTLPAALTIALYFLNQAFPLTLFLISLNFTHYIWDGLVWRTKPRGHHPRAASFALNFFK
ncbi:MAG: hypothetical protein EBX52_01200 [Proteobacteria bacterium]|nr:hypothetical protein [Pseudomonadota bacterium]